MEIGFLRKMSNELVGIQIPELDLFPNVELVVIRYVCVRRAARAGWNIVRIEFSPVVEISASNEQNLLQETTYEGLALSHV